MHAAGRGQGCCQTSRSAQDSSPPLRITWSKIVQRLRNWSRQWWNVMKPLFSPAEQGSLMLVTPSLGVLSLEWGWIKRESPLCWILSGLHEVQRPSIGISLCQTDENLMTSMLKPLLWFWRHQVVCWSMCNCQLSKLDVCPEYMSTSLLKFQRGCVAHNLQIMKYNTAYYKLLIAS